MYNTLASGFGDLASTTTSTCIFSKLIPSGFNSIGQTIDKPKPCSNERIRPSAILCAEHLRAYFNLSIKLETAKPSDNSEYINYYSLKFASAPDVLLPFPMKLKLKQCPPSGDVKPKTIDDYEFCLDEQAINNGFSGMSQYLQPNILKALLTNTHFSDNYVLNNSNYTTANPMVNASYAPTLLANKFRLNKFWEHVSLIAHYNETDLPDITTNSQIKIPMNMLPDLYKFLFYYGSVSNLVSLTPTADKNETQVMPPNILLNLSSQSFEIINKGVHNKIFTYRADGTETISTPIVLCAEKKVTNIQKENYVFNISSLLTNVPICSN